jgi:hypothetical protein
VDERNQPSGWRTPRYARPGEPARVIDSGRSDIATIAYHVDLPQDLSPDCLRSCAARCRDFAAHQPDPHRAELFRGLAASFEQHASNKERRLSARGL